ncbi:cyclopropane-fatty-acyl-phospholipid synthase [Ochrobactrum daejeonense]|uniref:Cyclopropane-fatty-acyl-phospholipid synthase n=1 Tax=Brucella daejeonensis TaxID=659015 RepID=A0A7W9EMJ4_9HYPH|nr:cyclopropane-fatty-acyl-phospholipid synthase family protein [Brucella daejeonensis]MBB5703513.1 cyclopropane-fatty-acyl-phospholipid synthase [Brucella daejeonensis]NKB78960.1 class I SAM-dependent methyltransferase [Brucella daejeonensis]
MTAESKSVRIIRTIVETLRPQFNVELWDGSVIGAFNGPTLQIKDPSIVRQIVLKPNYDSLIDVWTSGRIDIKNGTIFDLAELRTDGNLKQRIKALPKWQLLKDVPALLLAGKQKQDERIDGKSPFVSGSDKEAITHHYDVSNAFYNLFLDERMVYTCGYFTDWSNSLDQAQADKLELICRKLRLQPGDRLLDIGCGWGAMLIYAAKNFGVTGVGVSLSEEQTRLARERIKAAGLEDRITIHVKSYTELDEQFDKISSIGMFEHVGIANYDTYFSTVNKLLKPGGLYLHHAITRRMKRDKKAFKRKSAEHLALVKYIFPGGELDHLGMTVGNLEGHGFEVHDVENLREHYGRTCRLWAERLHANFEKAIAEVGYRKARLWLLYLSGCALAFERGTVQINQTLASRRKRGISAVPQTRDDIYRNFKPD